MKLRVWHIPQVPMEPFYVEVSTVDEGSRIMRILADYDLFQLHNNIKPDYSNAQGLEVFEDGEWCELEAWSTMTDEEIKAKYYEEMFCKRGDD